MDTRASIAAQSPAVFADSAPRARAPDKRQELMLSDPIVRTLLRFAAPTIVVVTVQALVGVMETYFVGFPGPTRSSAWRSSFRS
jgi:Na+-driven multidrug efflux pump